MLSRDSLCLSADCVLCRPAGLLNSLGHRDIQELPKQWKGDEAWLGNVTLHASHISHHPHVSSGGTAALSAQAQSSLPRQTERESSLLIHWA